APQAPEKPSSNRKLVLGVVGGALFALAAGVGLVVAPTTPSDSPSGSTPSSTPTRPRAPQPRGPAPPPAPTPPSAAPGPPLPAFVPPPDLGANCQYNPTPEGPSKPVNAPPNGPVSTTPAVINATITTNFGEIGIQLANAKSPCAVNSFVVLAKQQFFNNPTCGRLTLAADTGSLACGGPAADGTGGPGYEFADEYPVNQYPPGDPALRATVMYP